jgi:hypothetical protein
MLARKQAWGQPPRNMRYAASHWNRYWASSIEDIRKKMIDALAIDQSYAYIVMDQ